MDTVNRQSRHFTKAAACNVSGRTRLLMLSILCLSLTGIANANPQRNGLSLGQIDPSLFPTTNSVQNGAALSPQEARALLRAQRRATRIEARRLRRQSERQLKRAANRGEITAQLVLAETYSTEANTQALTIAAANAALGDALKWYSIAAKRGYPGGAAIDKLMPIPPMRVIKGP